MRKWIPGRGWKLCQTELLIPRKFHMRWHANCLFFSLSFYEIAIFSTSWWQKFWKLADHFFDTVYLIAQMIQVCLYKVSCKWYIYIKTDWKKVHKLHKLSLIYIDFYTRSRLNYFLTVVPTFYCNVASFLLKVWI